jgi:hypothetical protein
MLSSISELFGSDYNNIHISVEDRVHNNSIHITFPSFLNISPSCLENGSERLDVIYRNSIYVCSMLLGKNGRLEIYFAIGDGKVHIMT